MSATVRFKKIWSVSSSGSQEQSHTTHSEGVNVPMETAGDENNYHRHNNAQDAPMMTQHKSNHTQLHPTNAFEVTFVPDSALITTTQSNDLIGIHNQGNASEEYPLHKDVIAEKVLELAKRSIEAAMNNIKMKIPYEFMLNATRSDKTLSSFNFDTNSCIFF